MGGWCPGLDARLCTQANIYRSLKLAIARKFFTTSEQSNCIPASWRNGVYGQSDKRQHTGMAVMVAETMPCIAEHTYCFLFERTCSPCPRHQLLS